MNWHRFLLLPLIYLLLGATPGISPEPAISGSGRFSVFASAEKLLPLTGNCQQIFLKDQVTDQITLISQFADIPGDQDSSSPTISYDGRYIVFLSAATNLPAGSGNIYLYDQALTLLVSLDLNIAAKKVTMSGNGRVIAFITPSLDLYTYDLRNNLLTDVTTNHPGTRDFALNYQGDQLSFSSRATRLTDDTYYADVSNVFLYSLSKRTITLISKTQNEGGRGDSDTVALNDAGIYFVSRADNLGIGILFYSYQTAKLTTLISRDSSLITSLSVSFNNRYLLFLDDTTLYRYDLAHLVLAPIAGADYYAPLISGDGMSFTYADEVGQIYLKDLDHLAPIIVYDGPSEILVATEFDFFSYLSVTDADPELALFIVDEGNFSVQEVGVYTIIIGALDNSGNYQQLTITIEVLPERFPIYTGPEKINIRVNEPFSSLEKHLTFIDDSGQAIACYIINSDALDLSAVGTYSLTIGAKNQFDKETIVVVEVNVVQSVIGNFSALSYLLVPASIILLSFIILKYQPRPKKVTRKKKDLLRFYTKN